MRQILNSQPTIAYALIGLMVSMGAIDVAVFEQTVKDYNATLVPPAPPPVAPAPLSAVPPHLQTQTQYRTGTPPSTTSTPPNTYTNGYAQVPGLNYSVPPPPQNYATPPPATYPPPTSYPYQQPPPQPAPSSTPDLAATIANLPDAQKVRVLINLDFFGRTNLLPSNWSSMSSQ
jgi:cleavage stimulation factor subunit 2